MLGGIGIFVGILVGFWAAVAVGAAPASKELVAIVGGISILFVAGFLDDLFSLGPIPKLAAQFAAAGVVIFNGVTISGLVSNDFLAGVVALVWLVGMTNAFNLLDNMDGLAATLAGIAALFFAIDALTVHKNHAVLALSLALACSCAGFLPFNLRLGKSAAVFMGDSGSQVLGFALASLGLTASWKVAGTTVATLLLPILVLAVPILDTTLVTVVRLLDGRPVYQGGRDHTSHRLVYHGLSEKRAVVLLAVISAGLGGTSLAYNVLDNIWVTFIGVLLTFALLVQFASVLSDVERSPGFTGDRGWLRTFVANPRRLVESLVDFAVISASFTVAYYLRLQGGGSAYQRHIFLVSLVVVLAVRYLAFIPFGLYRGVWRYAGARDAASIVGAVVVSEVVAYLVLDATQVWGPFPRSVFVIDAIVCTVLIGASRFWERAFVRGVSSLTGRGDRHRTLIVGAGRGGRSLLRELRETQGEQVIGFVDDDPRLSRRRLQGVPVLGGTSEIEAILSRTLPHTVLVTIPDAPRERLGLVIDACMLAQVPCRFVRRDLDLDPDAVLGAAAD
ncbi:MAG: UDP-GlcNAc:undecaprenyl-phosphate/decaprenyl-phosphate GlcNAc-phosphate transferase [Gaiellaceae bacterium]|nr:UDP-GlcNAc:undecaprenyl-phosphate/decaprenyl-phosphate GlcNAc-phosphate transferase [Gaiellaceae bacterium]